MPAVAVAHWAARVGGMEPQVRAVLAEEGEDKALRVAEMEANKASSCPPSTALPRYPRTPGRPPARSHLAGTPTAHPTAPSASPHTPSSPPHSCFPTSTYSTARHPAPTHPAAPHTSPHPLPLLTRHHPLPRSSPLPFPSQASNLIDHHAEIMARPAKSWFQTPAQKVATKAAAMLQPQSTPAAEAAARRARIEAEEAGKVAAAAEKKAKVREWGGGVWDVGGGGGQEPGSGWDAGVCEYMRGWVLGV